MYMGAIYHADEGCSPWSRVYRSRSSWMKSFSIRDSMAPSRRIAPNRRCSLQSKRGTETTLYRESCPWNSMIPTVKKLVRERRAICSCRSLT